MQAGVVDAQVVVTEIVVGLDVDGRLEGRGRVVEQQLHFLARSSCRAVARKLLDRAVEGATDCSIPSSFPGGPSKFRSGAVEQRLGGFRVGTQHRFGIAVIGNAQGVVRPGKFGVEADGLVGIFDGLIVIAVTSIGVGPAGICQRRIWGRSGWPQ